MLEFAEEEFISASKGLDRPEYVRMLEAVASAELDHIVARDQDRFTRDRDLEFGELKALAKKAGVGVHAADTGPLFDTLAAELASGIRSEFGQFFAQVTGANTRKGLATRRAQGYYTAGLCFGYSKGGEVNQEQAARIREAYDWILNRGKSARDVFEHWRAEGVLTARGYQWDSVSNVIATLRRPTIAGLVTYKGEVLDVQARWEPIVTPEEQARLDAVLRANRRGVVGHGQRPLRRRWLSGLVLCGNPGCDGMTMTAKNPGPGRGYHWNCAKRRGGCGWHVRGFPLETVTRWAAVQLLRLTPAPPTPGPEGFDDTQLRDIERQIAEVRQALQERAMRAADAVPVLRDLRAQLEQEEAARDAHERRAMVSRDWHGTEFLQIVTGDGMAVRRLVDNVRVFRTGDLMAVVEGTNGASVDITPAEFEAIAAGDGPGIELVFEGDRWRLALDGERGQVVSFGPKQARQGYLA